MPTGTELDLHAQWDLIARGIYRRDNCLALYYEVERLHKVVQAQAKELEAAQAAKEIAMPKLNEEIYGGDPQGAANDIEIPLGDKPTLDVHGESDSRAVSEGNHGKQPSK